jgi:hypothetical protein
MDLNQPQALLEHYFQLFRELITFKLVLVVLEVLQKIH